MSIENQANAILFAFNNKLVLLKPRIKQSKVNEISKLIKKINALKNKKANEDQKLKNERKANKIIEEIKLIKKLKFNDIAIFGLENEHKFEQIMKSKPNLSLNEKALARIGTCKKLLAEIQKIKDSESDWKKLVIQYKSRLEKRRNWREKQKLYKDIEAKLIDKEAKIDDDIVEEMSNDDDSSDNDDEISLSNHENSQEQIIEFQDKQVNTEEKEKTNLTKNEANKEFTKETKKKKAKKSEKFEILFDQEEKNQQSDEEFSKVSYEKQIEIKKNTSYMNKLTNSLSETKQMVIKQINLEDLANLEEIPIEPVVNNDSNENNDETDQSNKKIDAFFLSKEGKEQGEPVEENYRKSFKRSNRYDDDYDNNPQYSKRNYESSFLNSLSSNGYKNEKYSNFKNLKKFDRQNGFEKKFTNEKYQKNDRQANGKKNLNKNNSKGHFEDRKGFKQQKFDKPVETKKSQDEDNSHLHPSWIAKKEQEEKLKSLKFEGKKVVFDE